MLRSERGLILPMTLLVMFMLVTLTAAFYTLSTTELQIATNHSSGGGTLGLAEAGLEEAIWAFNNPGASGITNTPIPARYTGTFVPFASGGYTITVVNPGTNERTVTATGWIPNNTASFPAKRTVTATLWSLVNRLNPPAVLNSKGTINLHSAFTVDARGACAPKKGTFSENATNRNGAKIYGNDPGNNTPNEGSDYSAFQGTSFLNPLKLTQEELGLLKELARANGTYYSGTGVRTLTFDSNNPLRNGIVFVDTVNGTPMDTTPAVDWATVHINNGVSASGWLVVMGSIFPSGNISYTGLIYAENDFDYTASGNGGGVTGAVIVHHVATTTTSFSGDDGVTATLKYDCRAINTGLAEGAAGDPIIPQSFFVKPGTWREITG